MPTPAPRTANSYRSSLRRSASSARFLSVMSLITAINAAGFPVASRIAAPVTSPGKRVPTFLDEGVLNVPGYALFERSLQIRQKTLVVFHCDKVERMLSRELPNGFITAQLECPTRYEREIPLQIGQDDCIRRRFHKCLVFCFALSQCRLGSLAFLNFKLESFIRLTQFAGSFPDLLLQFIEGLL